MQNKPHFFFGNRGSQKGGRGSDTWEQFPKKSRFLGGAASLIRTRMAMMMKAVPPPPVVIIFGIMMIMSLNVKTDDDGVPP